MNSRGKQRTRIPAKARKIGTDKRIQVGVYTTEWRDGPIGEALTDRGIPLNPQ
jgi:hypothetical protein